MLQLAAAGAHVATCDISRANVEQTVSLATADAPAGVKITPHLCDVSDERQVAQFASEVAAEHGSDSVNLLINNAGIGGGGSFLNDERSQWERTFNVCWYGVYYCCRAFLPMVMKSDEGYVVNVSSINGFWGSLGPHVSHTAYSAAKFAVKGFTEALRTDLALNAPHVKASVVMPGHIGTSIVSNSAEIHGEGAGGDLSVEQVQALREQWGRLDASARDLSDDQVRELSALQGQMFKDSAPTSAAEAATVILDGVKAEQWRILIGDDAAELDRRVRANPEEAYTEAFYTSLTGDGFVGVPS